MRKNQTIIPILILNNLNTCAFPPVFVVSNFFLYAVCSRVLRFVLFLTRTLHGGAATLYYLLGSQLNKLRTISPKGRISLCSQPNAQTSFAVAPVRLSHITSHPAKTASDSLAFVRSLPLVFRVLISIINKYHIILYLYIIYFSVYFPVRPNKTRRVTTSNVMSYFDATLIHVVRTNKQKII